MNDPRLNSRGQRPPVAPELLSPPQAGAPEAEKQIKVDGFAQVLAMLQIADPEFRDSLLRRLAARDIELARALQAELRKTL